MESGTVLYTCKIEFSAYPGGGGGGGANVPAPTERKPAMGLFTLPICLQRVAPRLRMCTNLRGISRDFLV